MPAVLGIDAAWTVTEPSGVAVAVRVRESWKLCAVAPSYAAFLALSQHQTIAGGRHRGSDVEARALLSRAADFAGAEVDLVAIDMPLSYDPICARRMSDNLVSSAYGARHCSTHTPSATRPGRISDDLRAGFAQAGYPLLTTDVCIPGLVEVYPHPALVELTGSERRLPYKHGKIRNYWPTDSTQVRRENLVDTWKLIMTRLERELDGVGSLLNLPPVSARGWEMKAFEDMLDAVVCAWIGVTVLEGRARAYGDERSAIWIPEP